MVAALKKEQANEVKKKDQTASFCFCFKVSLCGISFSSWISYDFLLIILSTVSYSIISFDSHCKDYCIEELNKNKSRSRIVSRDVFPWLGFALGKFLVDFFEG